ncbi:LacI family DNA-binding transcriptional regulator [Ancrocorticia populi]|nr:LacI family DNA-binding transcriptional regulator [Ancrocorticia populi]
MASRPTQADVAVIAGVSRQTVSLVVRDDPRVSDQKRDAVHAAMQELGYHTNLAARALASNRTRFIGIVLSVMDNPFHSHLVELIRQHCETANLIPFIAPVGENTAEESIAITRFSELNVDGLILISPLLEEDQIQGIASRTPTVLVTRNVGPENADLVHTDDVAGGRMATEHLLDAGYERVIFLGYDRPVPGDSSVLRWRGYEQVMGEVAQAPHSYLRPKEAVTATARSILEQFGAGTGIVCHNDMIAIEVIGVLGEFGLALGKDIGIVGFDNTRIGALPAISLTSIDQQTEEIARKAMNFLTERVEGQRSDRKNLSLPSTLIPRGSTQRTR